jgi:hypothetical protein
MPSRQLISDVNSVLGLLRRVKVGDAGFIFKVDVCKVRTCRILCKDQPWEGSKDWCLVWANGDRGKLYSRLRGLRNPAPPKLRHNLS